MTRVITDAEQVTTVWLTQALTRSGALTAGAVADFELTVEASTFASVAKIRPSYTPEAMGQRPPALFLKMCAGSGFLGYFEVDYYTRDYVGLADAPIVPCYDAGYSAETGAYHLLLADLSATHRNNWQIPPTLAHGLAMARTLATLHAYHWTPTQRATIGAVIHDAAHIQRYVDVAQAGLEPLLDNVRADMDPAWETALRAVFAHHPRLMLERAQNPIGFTVIHGDLNPGNILSPLDGPGKVYPVDRQPFDWSLTTWLGAHDLAYMMVTWWPTDVRRSLEMDVLREYLTHLIQRGITDYPWAMLVEDYRLSVAQAVYVPTEWCSTESGLREMKWVWWPQLQRSMAAFEDWACATLWT